MKRTATAVWNGSGKDGSGHLTTQSTSLNKTQYSYKSRFEEGVGTNPEELIAAAHAGPPRSRSCSPRRRRARARARRDMTVPMGSWVTSAISL